MTSKLNQRLETVINVAIISIIILIGYILVQTFLLTPSNKLVSNNPSQNSGSPSNPPQARIQIGTKVNFSGIDWKENEKTLVIYSRKGCRFCTESMSFYKKLAEKKDEFATKIIVVSTDTVETSKEYFAENGVNLSEFRQSKSIVSGLRGTPTLLLVDNKGKVLSVWVGRLPKEKEKEVVSQL